MKILIISNLYPPYVLGGYELACRNVANELSRRNHQVHVLTSASHFRDTNSDLPESVPTPTVSRTLHLRSWQPTRPKTSAVELESNFEAMVSNYGNTATLIEYIYQFEPDVVYLFNLLGIGGIGLIDTLNSMGIRWVMHLMDQMPVALESGISEKVLSVFNASDGDLYKPGVLVSMSRHLLLEIEASIDLNQGKLCHVIPGWVEPRKLKPVRRSYFDRGVVRFVTAGSVRPEKGTDLILRAAKRLLDQNIQNFTIDIYGQGDTQFFAALAHELGVQNYVSFKGNRTQSELLEIYARSDVFLFPTWEREPFGFAPVEAASEGCVPILTSSCGAAERLISNVNAIKIDRSVGALASAMVAFCSNTLDIESLGWNAQIVTHGDLSFRTCVDSIEDVICATGSFHENATNLPSWKYINLSYLKHNLAIRFHTEEHSSEH